MSAPAAGFFGKLPARGDFVRAGLPRSFVDPWDEWWQRGLGAAQAMPGWAAAWLVAPVWRFGLAAGVCGPGAVLGVWLPSVDRAGRCFPLAVAAVGDAAALAEAGARGFLHGAEQAALDALYDDLSPDALAERIAAAAGPPGGGPPPMGACWWTEGSPRVAASFRATAGLPGGPAFAALFDDAWAALEPCP